MEPTAATETEINEVFADRRPMSADELPVLRFTKIEQFTTFRAEYAFEDGDIVFHFFLPPEYADQLSQASVRKYWLEMFPALFEPVVMDTFKAEPPRVQAKYIPDHGLNSWWFRAFGFARGLDPERLCGVFCENLDAALDQALSATKKT